MMKLGKLGKVYSLGLLLLISLWLPISVACADETIDSNSPTQMLQGEVASRRVLNEDTEESLGIISTVRGANTYIDSIRPASQAFYAGIKQDDQLLDAQIDGNNIYLTLARNGQTFRVKLAMDNTAPSYPLRAENPATGYPNSPFNLSANKTGIVGMPQFSRESAKVDLSQSRTPLSPWQTLQWQQPQSQQMPLQQPFQGQVRDFGPALAYVIDQNQARLLASYDIEFILDISGSMKTLDCPGGLSRWDWCGYQAVAIARAVSRYVPYGITVTPFARDYQVYEHANPNMIAQIYDMHEFHGGTRLCEPLTERINSYFRNRAFYKGRPHLIVVITDGLPNPKPEPEMVRQELVMASQQIMMPGELSVVFLQIGGDDFRGRNYLVDLGSSLMSYGARSQFVHTNTFEELEKIGLAQAIVNDLQQYGSYRQASAWRR
jgi:hypothetical protein